MSWSKLKKWLGLATGVVCQAAALADVATPVLGTKGRIVAGVIGGVCLTLTTINKAVNPEQKLAEAVAPVVPIK